MATLRGRLRNSTVANQENAGEKVSGYFRTKRGVPIGDDGGARDKKEPVVARPALRSALGNLGNRGVQPAGGAAAAKRCDAAHAPQQQQSGYGANRAEAAQPEPQFQTKREVRERKQRLAAAAVAASVAASSTGNAPGGRLTRCSSYVSRGRAAGNEKENVDPRRSAGRHRSTSPILTDDRSALKPCNAYSETMLLVADIDADDGDDPFLCSEYVRDIYQYLRHLEDAEPITPDYLAGRRDMTGKMRAILVDWLVQVQIRLHMLPETLFTAVTLVDRVFQSERINKHEVQLIGVTCLLIAGKYEEVYAPEVSDLVYLCDGAYGREQVLKMEVVIMRMLNHSLCRPVPVHFLRRFSKAVDADVWRHTLAKYIMETSMIDHTVAHVRPSLCAAGSLALALTLHNSVEHGVECTLLQWPAELQHYSGYKVDDVHHVAVRLAAHMLRVHTDRVKYQAVRSKYSTSKFMSIAKSDYMEPELLHAFVHANAH